MRGAILHKFYYIAQVVIVWKLWTILAKAKVTLCKTQLIACKKKKHINFDFEDGEFINRLVCWTFVVLGIFNNNNNNNNINRCYGPNFEKVEGTYCFGLVHVLVCQCVRSKKLSYSFEIS